MAVVIGIRDNNDVDVFHFGSGGGGIIKYVTGTFRDSYDGTKEDKIVSFRTVAKGTETQIRNAFKELEYLLYKINLWISDKTIDEGIFLEVTHSGEDVRYSLLKAWSRIDINDGVADPLLDKSTMVITDWEFTRHYAWEYGGGSQIQKSNLTVSCNTGGAMVGNTADQTADHDGFEWDGAADTLGDGTREGRIERTTIAIPQTSTGKNWDRIWIGMKPVEGTDPTLSTKYRAQTNFSDAFGMTKIDTNVDGAFTTSLGLNGEVSEIDFTASPGTGWAARLYNQIPHIWKSSARGSYLILFRMKVDAGTVARVGMFFAWDNYLTNQGKADHYEDLYVDDSAWHIYEMGVIQVPPEGMRAVHTPFLHLGKLNIGLSAERISGSGSLYVDYATWIPQDHFLTAKNCKIGGSAAEHKLFVFTVDDDEVTGYGRRTSPDEHYPAEIATNNWTWPADTDKELLVVAIADGYFEDNEAHEFNKSFDTELVIRPRYFSYNPD